MTSRKNKGLPTLVAVSLEDRDYATLASIPCKLFTLRYLVSEVPDFMNVPFHTSLGPKYTLELYLRDEFFSQFKFLLSRGARMGSAEDFDMLLHRVESVRMQEELLKHGANVNCLYDGISLLHYCSSAEQANLFIKYRADVNARDAYGQTPLHTNSCARVIKVLLQAKADPNARNNLGQTPLFDTYARPHKVRALLDYTDKNIKDHSGQTACVFFETSPAIDRWKTCCRSCVCSSNGRCIQLIEDH